MIRKHMGIFKDTENTIMQQQRKKKPLNILSITKHTFMIPKSVK